MRKPTHNGPPKGRLLVGFIDDQQPVYLSARDRSMHALFIGSTGCGKTTAMERCARQDLGSGRGLCIIDPMGSLYERVLDYACYLKAIGLRVPEVIPCDFSSGQWAVPFNPFIRRDGDISVQVDRRVSAVLRAWGQSSGDETPRLEKWLKVIFSVLIEQGLTILEAAHLLNQNPSPVRNHLLQGFSDPFIQQKLAQLSTYRASEFLQQVESAENRLMRFLTSETLRRTMGPGSSALDFSSIVEQGKILLVNLRPSNHLSVEQQRLIGTLIIDELYETAITRKSGAKPYYLYVDEAAQFVTPELGMALEQCRQKGLHFTLAFQHLAQFREEGMRVYKAVKNNVRTKLVFAIPDRQDAQELADDVFVGLAEPQLKYMHRHLNHLQEDVRYTSTTHSQGHSQAVGRNWSNSRSMAEGRGSMSGRSFSKNHSVENGFSRGRTSTRGHSQESGDSSGHTHSQHESHTRGFTENTSSSDSKGENSSESLHERKEEGLFSGYSDSGRSKTSGESSSSSSSRSRTDTGSDTYDSGDSHTQTSTKTTGASTSLALSRSKQKSRTQGTGSTSSTQTSRSITQTTGSGSGRSTERGTSFSDSISDQPGVRHTAFWEEDPEHWTLEEQRWRASEIIMRQQVGECIVTTASALGALSVPKPKAFYISPNQLLEFQRRLYQQHCLSRDQADQLIAERTQQLLQQANARINNSRPYAEGGQAWHSPRPQLWNRTQKPAAPSPVQEQPTPTGKRGPKADLENKAKVAHIITAYPSAWWTRSDDLWEICDKLDQQKVPVPKGWRERRDVKTGLWVRALERRKDIVIKAIKDRLKGPADHNS